MPELPEVEVTRRGIEARVKGACLDRAVLRAPSLRYPIPDGLGSLLAGRTLLATRRRGKYLLLHFGDGNLLIHLGMSGSLRYVSPDTPPGKHDHADFVFSTPNETIVLRLTDPRRFGALLWLTGDPQAHPLLSNLGIEPLTADFNAGWLHAALRRKALAIKPALMDNRLIVGVGNIYAAESLFKARIDPRRPAGRIAPVRLERLVAAIQSTLHAAITAGGSTLRDFCNTEGGMGDFQTSHHVYDRAGEPCLTCGTPIRAIRQGQRSTYFCPRCQR